LTLKLFLSQSVFFQGGVMSVTLSQKLASIKDDQIVTELDWMLRGTDVYISFWGQRMVGIAGFLGAVSIDELAEKYLRAPGQDSDLGGKIHSLYIASDGELKKKCLCKHWTFLRENVRECIFLNNPQEIIRLDYPRLPLS